MSQVVVITGASSGIGRATALRFAREGARIGLIARSLEALEAARRDVEAAGGEGLPIPLDVANADALDAAADQIEAKFGPIDVWINDAALSLYSPIMEMSPEEYRRVTEVTYLGQVYGTLAALRRMQSRNRGKIVLVGSGFGYRGVPLQSAYCAAKFALRGFHDSLQAELRSMNSRVSVTLVQPSTVNTPFYSWALSKLPNRPNAAGPVYQPEVIAEAIHWAARHHRRELPIGWPSALGRATENLLPSATDWLAGKLGVWVQTSPKPHEIGVNEGNLWETVPGEHAVHGEFGERAHTFSPQTWTSQNRAWLGLAAVGLAGAVWATVRGRSQEPR